jgi:protein-S-isoprenylcysteine O-methyltransferase Ste14
MNIQAQIGLVYFFSEVALRFMRRAGKSTKQADRGSLALLWVAIVFGVTAGIYATHLAPGAAFQLPPAGMTVAVVIFALGLVLRWWSILVLGKFFTVEVAIASDHKLVVRGPYKIVRHPSYSGLMLAFVGFALTLQNWVSLALVLVPIAAALAYRVRIEETALVGAFGDEYRNYSRTTKRLIPGIF